MGKTEHRIAYKAGITRTPSDFLCEDGELAECINLTTDHEELKVMVDPQLTDISVDGSLCFVHHVEAGTTNYIYVSGSLLMHEAENILGGGTLSGTPKIQSIGKTLIVADNNGMRFTMWNGTEGKYKYLGDQIPRPRVNFYLGGYYDNLVEEEISCKSIIVYENNRWWVGVNKQGDWNNAVVGLYEKLKKKLHQKKCFYGSFCVRVALKLYNGSYYHISNPIMMANQFNSYCVADIRDESLCLVTMKLWGQELYYKMLEDYSEWSDIVSEVTLFVSAEERMHDTNADATIDAGREHVPICDFISGNLFYHHSEHVDYTGDSGTRHIVLNSISDDEVGKNLVENGVFYKLCGLGKQSMSDFAKTSSHFTVHTLENIQTQTQLPNDDYFSHCRMMPGFIYAYNSRLNLANVKRGFFSGFNLFLPYSNENTFTYQAYVYIKTTSGVRIVRSHYSTQQKQGLYFYYPDPRAYKAEIYLMSGQQIELLFSLTLKEHPSLNGAYYFRGFPDGSEGEPGNDGDWENEKAVNDEPEDLGNQIVTSEVNCPLVYNANGYNAVGDGQVLAMATQSVALSEGQFGAFPLIVFTDRGLWAMSVDRTGLYEATDPMPREVCINPNAILETDGAVFFVSQKGLMVIVGNKVQCVSELINGVAFNTGDVPDIATGNDWSSIIGACASGSSFLEYIRDSRCFLAYDYADSRILIIQPGKSYSFVYNIADGTISKTIINGSNNIARAVRSYPDCLLQDTDNKVYTLYNKEREDEVSARKKGFLITRPMKLSGPVSVKSLRELVNVGCWSKKNGSRVKTQVFVSDNLEDWYTMASRFGAAAKYFRIALYIEMLPTERLSGTILYDQERRNENARVNPAP